MRRHNGTIAGAIAGIIIGALAGGPWLMVLGIVGLFAGRLFDSLYDPDQPDPDHRQITAAEIDRDARALFARHLALLFFHVARADGEFNAAEVEVVDNFFVERLGFDDDDQAGVDRAFALARDNEDGVEPAARACRDAMNPPERLLLLDGLFEVAAANGNITATESAVIRQIARQLEISEEDEAFIRREHVEESAESYLVLGLDEDATNSEIKAAFRQMAARHHPDKVAHLGEGASDLAGQRFLEIQGAYDRLRQSRGF